MPSAKRPEHSAAEVLREQIKSGQYSAGDWLPAERALAKDFGVDRRTVHLAIDRLVDGGLVIRHPHCRPIVSSAGEGDKNREKSQAPSATSNFVALVMWPW